MTSAALAILASFVGPCSPGEDRELQHRGCVHTEQGPGDFPQHLSSMTSRAQEAKNEKALRALLKQPDNSRCFNCGTRVCSGFQVGRERSQPTFAC